MRKFVTLIGAVIEAILMTGCASCPDVMYLHPEWIPDGSRIAYIQATEEGSYTLHIMNPDGSSDALMPTGDMAVDSFAFSPDGDRVAVVNVRTAGIFLMNTDGTDIDEWFESASFPAGSGQMIASYNTAQPAWSPDGTMIAFTSMHKKQMDLYYQTLVNTRLERLTDDREIERSPAWSSDGKQLAFVSNHRGADRVYILDIATGKRTLLNRSDDDVLSPAWSPDGLSIAVVTDQGITIMPTDGSESRFVIEGNYPSWSHDGEQLVFVSDQTGLSDIYIINADGTNLTQLTHNPTGGICPH